VATPNLCSHAHTYTSSHTHTTRISKRKRDRGTHTTLAKWGSVSRKINKKKKLIIIEDFPPVSTVVHECVFFPTHPGLWINLLRVRKTLRASVATSVGRFRKFQHSLISSACFHAHGRYSSRCRISAILVSSESWCYLFSQGTGLAQRRAWVRKIWSCERRSLERSLCQGVIF
jgi:hypothetical protein